MVTRKETREKGERRAGIGNVEIGGEGVIKQTEGARMVI